LSFAARGAGACRRYPNLIANLVNEAPKEHLDIREPSHPGTPANIGLQ
jgi:hypothetical protein